MSRTADVGIVDSVTEKHEGAPRGAPSFRSPCARYRSMPFAMVWSCMLLVPS
jgi:hypothetical protein